MGCNDGGRDVRQPLGHYQPQLCREGRGNRPLGRRPRIAEETQGRQRVLHHRAEEELALLLNVQRQLPEVRLFRGMRFRLL